jgi:hypothetical protein
MNVALVTAYGLIALLTVLMMSIVVSYLRQKAVEKQFVRDRIKRDLALLVGTSVVLQCSAVIAREVSGPFEVDTVQVSMWRHDTQHNEIRHNDYQPYSE